MDAGEEGVWKACSCSFSVGLPSDMKGRFLGDEMEVLFTHFCQYQQLLATAEGWGCGMCGVDVF